MLTTGIVCVKRVLIETRGGIVKQQYETNPFDEVAMEAGLEMKEKKMMKRIVAISVGRGKEGEGEEEEEKGLRKALSMGADQAIHIKARTETPLLVATAIAEMIKRETLKTIGVVVLGQQSTDTTNCQVPQILAGILGWQQATFVTSH